MGWCAVGRHGGRELRMYVGRYVGRYVGSVPRFSVPYTKTNTDIFKMKPAKCTSVQQGGAIYDQKTRRRKKMFFVSTDPDLN